MSDPPRQAVLSPVFRRDLTYWIETDRKTALRLMALVEAIMRDPFTGIGKPERLKRWDDMTWSRRLNEADRLTYTVFPDRIEFIQGRYHYDR